MEKKSEKMLAIILLALIQGNFVCDAGLKCKSREVFCTIYMYTVITNRRFLPPSGFVASGAVEVQPSINPAAIGDTVTLSLSPPAALKSGSWSLGESLILTWVGDQQAVVPSYSGRASVNVLTGAITLRSVTVADSGVYVVQSSDPQLRADTSISVLGETEVIHYTKTLH